MTSPEKEMEMGHLPLALLDSSMSETWPDQQKGKDSDKSMRTYNDKEKDVNYLDIIADVTWERESVWHWRVFAIPCNFFKLTKLTKFLLRTLLLPLVQTLAKAKGGLWSEREKQRMDLVGQRIIIGWGWVIFKLVVWGRWWNRCWRTQDPALRQRGVVGMDLCIEETVVRGGLGCPSDQKASRLTVCRAGCCPSHLARLFKVMIPKNLATSQPPTPPALYREDRTLSGLLCWRSGH